MTEVCDRVRIAVLQSFDHPAPLSLPADIADHIRRCQSCAAFVRGHQHLDARLAIWYTAPSLGPAFRRRLRREIRRDKVGKWSEWVPSIMHLVGFSGVLLLYVAVAPEDMGRGMTYGIVAALFLWAALSGVTAWMEDSCS